jgi:hypothetical protein
MGCFQARCAAFELKGRDEVDALNAYRLTERSLSQFSVLTVIHVKKLNGRSPAARAR